MKFYTKLGLIILAVGIVLKILTIDITNPSNDQPSQLRLYRPIWYSILAWVLEKVYCDMDWSMKDKVEEFKREHGMNFSYFPNEQTFYRGFEEIEYSMKHETNFTCLGKMLYKGQILTNIEDRLKIAQYIENHKDIYKEEIKQPVFVVGMPRTGTTFMFNLLAMDNDSFRALRMWEGLDPIPPTDPELGNWHYTRFPRMARLKILFYLWQKFAWFLRDRHSIDVNNPEECTQVFVFEGRSMKHACFLFSASYLDWYFKQSRSLEFHKTVYQLFQYKASVKRTWLFKSPEYPAQLDEIWETYPDAKIIMMHREPLGAIVSFMSLMTQLNGLVSDEMNKKKIVSKLIFFETTLIIFC